MVLRRTFLQLIGAAPVAAAVAPSAIATEAVTAAASPVSAVGLAGSAAKMVGETFFQKKDKSINRLLKDKARQELLRQFKPAWWVKDIKEDARRSAYTVARGDSNYAEFYHKNILALKSVSPAAKACMIQDDNYRRALRGEGFDYLDVALGRTQWEKVNAAVSNYDDGDDGTELSSSY